jgi:ketosteroid isomerase-like protein
MITREFASRFADEWIAAWNAHDLARILSHYTEDFEMSSPFIAKVMGGSNGTLKGREAVGAYWKKVFEKMPELHFELIEVFSGMDTICICYKSVLGLRAVEWLQFNEAGKVLKASAHYDDFPK